MNSQSAASQPHVLLDEEELASVRGGSITLSPPPVQPRPPTSVEVQAHGIGAWPAEVQAWFEQMEQLFSGKPAPKPPLSPV